MPGDPAQFHVKQKRTYRYESELEADCTDVAVSLGAEHRKLDTGVNAKGQLDHAYWLPHGVHFIVEFKLPGERPSPKQKKKIARLRALGHAVHVIDSYEGFLDLLR